MVSRYPSLTFNLGMGGWLPSWHFLCSGLISGSILRKSLLVMFRNDMRCWDELELATYKTNTSTYYPISLAPYQAQSLTILFLNLNKQYISLFSSKHKLRREYFEHDLNENSNYELSVFKFQAGTHSWLDQQSFKSRIRPWYFFNHFLVRGMLPPETRKSWTQQPWSHSLDRGVSGWMVFRYLALAKLPRNSWLIFTVLKCPSLTKSPNPCK